MQHETVVNLKTEPGANLPPDELKMVTSALFELTVDARGIAAICKRLEEQLSGETGPWDALDAACLAALAAKSSMKMGWLADRVMCRLDPAGEDLSHLDEWLLPPNLRKPLSRER